MATSLPQLVDMLVVGDVVCPICSTKLVSTTVGGKLIAEHPEFKWLTCKNNGITVEIQPVRAVITET
jgi:hypothetical protein